MKERGPAAPTMQPSQEAPQDPYEKIRQMPHIRRIEVRGGEFRVIPPEQLDFSVFGAAADNAKKAYEALDGWLHMPFISDDFVIDADRSAWRLALPADIRNIVNQNKFRNNPAAIALGFMQMLAVDVADAGKEAQKRVQDFLRNEEPTIAVFNVALPRAKGEAARRAVMETLEHKIAGMLAIVAAIVVWAKLKTKGTPKSRRAK